MQKGKIAKLKKQLDRIQGEIEILSKQGSGFVRSVRIRRRSCFVYGKGNEVRKGIAQEVCEILERQERERKK